MFFAGWAGSSLVQHLAAKQNGHTVGKAVDSSGISHHLSTEKSRCLQLFTPALQLRSRASTGFEATQVGVSQRKIGVIHKIGVLYYYYYVFIELLKKKREQVRFRQRP